MDGNSSVQRLVLSCVETRATSASVANIPTGYVLGMKTCACALECLVVMIQCKALWPNFHKSFNFVCLCVCSE